MKPRIISDSSCDLPANYLEKDGIDFSVVPLKIIVGDHEFIDDETLNTKVLINAMKEYKEASSSACPSPEDFAAELRKNDENYVIAMTSGLSGTYNSARVAADMVLEEDSSKKIRLFDSLATSTSMILMIMKLRDMIKAGTMDFEAICDKLSEYQKSLTLVFLLQDLSNLVKTGRMSKVAGVVASKLSIMPIARATDQGKIEIVEKTRGIKKALSAMANMVSEKAMTHHDFPVVISHCNNLSQAEILRDLLEKRFNLKEIYIFPMHGLTSYYANDKGLIMSF
ncbi:DegV family EDD domain-containing protein [Acetobacterium fimetarium]|uniref:DegV family EDD domain-containing protein n=1 Tax=Acetobacterium fimetarium TaxID=52691 RepID=A0ABR6WX39_9FIRM|nr:DegV family protein [Acetobacterium fimetarium]MBC3804940.1 DegV family EDD domain-containing protein [Acetobacterium fimetarium]